VSPGQSVARQAGSLPLPAEPPEPVEPPVPVVEPGVESLEEQAARRERKAREATKVF
jgi:hypothetical protein